MLYHLKWASENRKALSKAEVFRGIGVATAIIYGQEVGTKMLANFLVFIKFLWDTKVL